MKSKSKDNTFFTLQIIGVTEGVNRVRTTCVVIPHFEALKKFLTIKVTFVFSSTKVRDWINIFSQSSIVVSYQSEKFSLKWEFPTCSHPHSSTALFLKEGGSKAGSSHFILIGHHCRHQSQPALFNLLYMMLLWWHKTNKGYRMSHLYLDLCCRCNSKKTNYCTIWNFYYCGLRLK